MSLARADRLIEDVPMPQPSVAAQIKLARADAAHGHADIFKFAAAQNFRRAARKK